MNNNIEYLVAIGDIHVCLNELKELVLKVELFFKDKNSSYKYIFLGDYVDRGPDSKGVLEYVKEMVDNCTAIAIMGNHEAMAIESFFEKKPNADPDYYDIKLVNLEKSHIIWMSKLPIFVESPLHFFVHAGVNPVRSLKNQNNNEMLWIRNPFLEYIGPFEKYIVHGHTPTNFFNENHKQPDIRDFRCNMDSGCVFGGALSAAIFDIKQVKPVHIIMVPFNNGEIK